MRAFASHRLVIAGRKRGSRDERDDKNGKCEY
jgi:hypothetical protein